MAYLITTFKNSSAAYILLFLLFHIHLSRAHNQSSSPAFIENKGQILNQDYEPNNEVLYLYAGKNLKIQLRKTGYSYEIFKIEGEPLFQTSKKDKDYLETLKNIKIKNYRVDIDFAGMNTTPTILAEQKTAGYLNYYVCGYDVSHVSSFRKVTYKNIYKNTDIEFIINENEANPLKYNIILHPGADINQVKFLINGAASLRTDNGTLAITTPLGTIHENIPFSYYTDSPATNKKVDFSLQNNTLSFLTDYDRSKTLIIDPSSNLIWSTYYSGPSIDYCMSTRVDAQNNVYISGHTFSTSDIATNNGFEFVHSGVLDAYLVKFDPNGVRQWATYYGGSSVEQIYAMHIDSNGAIYITGDTFSTSNIATPGVHQTVYGGGIDDVMLVKFDTNGLRVWATYYGGSEHEFAQAITTDSEHNVIIGGHSQSLNAIATPNAYSTVYNFGEEGFIAKFTSNGALIWGTYYGDSGNDIVYSLACDAAKNVYATGLTTSISGFATPGAHQPNAGGNQDGFLARFNPSGTARDWGTYYGGAGNDECTVVRVSPSNLLYLTGNTSSANDIATPGSFQPTLTSAEDGFLASFNANGTRLWATYFGGDATDYINDMVLDANANLVFCGQTLSTNSISTSGAYQSTITTPGNYEAYFAKFSNTGSRKLATYFGAANNDNARGICVDKTGKVYLAGETTSTIGIATAMAHQTVALGSTEAFLAKFCMDIEPIISPANTVICAGPTTLSAVNGYSTYLWSNGATINPIVVTTMTTMGTYQFTVYVTDGFGCTGASNTVTFTTIPCINISIQEHDDSGAISLYPIPSREVINIKLKNETSGAALIEIYSVTGQMLRTVKLTDTNQAIDITFLKPGIYVMRTLIDGNERYSKFIKE